MTLSLAQEAGQRDRAAEMFAVYTDSGQVVITTTRALAVEMAWRTNGSWTRIAR